MRGRIETESCLICRNAAERESATKKAGENAGLFGYPQLRRAGGITVPVPVLRQAHQPVRPELLAFPSARYLQPNQWHFHRRCRCRQQGLGWKRQAR
ncbi:hypothetical protein RHIZ404_220647 [Rhizobium sp. EC-SD404]|nr:hypothetical protein RHIZ404_220647 [Rhizobium sp. EC-SD404]